MMTERNMSDSEGRLRVDQGRMLYRLLNFLQRQRFDPLDLPPLESISKKSLRLGETSETLLEKNERAVFRFRWFALTYAPDGLPGPSGGGNISCSRGWNLFFPRLYRTPKKVTDSIQTTFKFYGIGLTQLNEFTYCIDI